MTVSDAKTHCQEDREANEANETMSYSNQIAKYCAMNIQEDRGTCRCYGVCKQQGNSNTERKTKARAKAASAVSAARDSRLATRDVTTSNEPTNDNNATYLLYLLCRLSSIISI